MSFPSPEWTPDLEWAKDLYNKVRRCLGLRWQIRPSNFTISEDASQLSDDEFLKEGFMRAAKSFEDRLRNSGEPEEKIRERLQRLHADFSLNFEKIRTAVSKPNEEVLANPRMRRIDTVSDAFLPGGKISKQNRH